MLGPFVVVLLVVVIVAILVGMTGRRSPRRRESTAGHYDPDAIGSYTLDPATMRYRHDLPTLPPGASARTPGKGAPHRRRRPRHRPDAGSG